MQYQLEITTSSNPRGHLQGYTAERNEYLRTQLVKRIFDAGHVTRFVHFDFIIKNLKGESNKKPLAGKSQILNNLFASIPTKFLRFELLAGKNS